MDDYVNLRPKPYRLVDRGHKSAKVAKAVSVSAGDRVILSNPETGETIAADVDAVSADGLTLKLSENPGSASFLYPYREAAPLTVFRYNTFLGGYRYGLLLRVIDSVIEGNFFDRLGAAAIALENHPWWKGGPEGLASERVRIVGNTVRHNRDEDGAIFTGIRKANREYAGDVRGFFDIDIIANEIVDWQFNAISLRHAIGGQIACNQIKGSDAVPLEEGKHEAIRVNHASGIRVRGNGFSDKRTGYESMSVVNTDDTTIEDGHSSLRLADCGFVPGHRGASHAPAWP
jgi:hypothetical protein